MLRLIFPLCFVLSGCASLDDVVGGIANTPEWFQERRVEIRGDGYPDFADVPTESDSRAIWQSLENTKSVVLAELEAFLSSSRIEPANVTTDDMSQLAAKLNGEIPDLNEIDNILLKPAEIEALQAQMQPPPINTPN